MVDNNTPSQFSGEWKNDMGSIVQFNFEENGKLTGLYYTKVGSATQKEPLVGFYETKQPDNSILVGFTVAWRHVVEGKFPSMCVWTGRILPNTTEMKTAWILTGTPKKEKDRWNTMSLGNNIFKKET